MLRAYLAEPIVFINGKLPVPDSFCSGFFLDLLLSCLLLNTIIYALLYAWAVDVRPPVLAGLLDDIAMQQFRGPEQYLFKDLFRA